LDALFLKDIEMLASEEDMKKLRKRLDEQDKAIRQIQADLRKLKKKVEDNEYDIFQLQNE